MDIVHRFIVEGATSVSKAALISCIWFLLAITYTQRHEHEGGSLMAWMGFIFMGSLTGLLSGFYGYPTGLWAIAFATVGTLASLSLGSGFITNHEDTKLKRATVTLGGFNLMLASLSVLVRLTIAPTSVGLNIVWICSQGVLVGGCFLFIVMFVAASTQHLYLKTRRKV